MSEAQGAQFQTEGLQAASRAAKAQSSKDLPDRLKLNNGIVLKVRAMPPMLLNSVANSIPEPEVPKVWIEEKGREEENPNHPAYLKAIQDRQAKLAIATNDLILYACTSLETLPEGLDSPESDNWLILAKMAGIEVDSNDKLQRYVAWLKCYAISNVSDMLKVTSLPVRLSGVSEEEVAEMEEMFRSGEGWDTDQELSSGEPSKNGNNVQNIGSGSNRASRRARS